MSLFCIMACKRRKSSETKLDAAKLWKLYSFKLSSKYSMICFSDYFIRLVLWLIDLIRLWKVCELKAFSHWDLILIKEMHSERSENKHLPSGPL